ncbi:ATP-binding protein [Desulfococcaceae bacterium HSG9]|nr:ATP-binding protein [Desulfococcaceae bacterium HSG9]
MDANNKLLVVDDDPGVRESIKWILSKSEHTDTLAKGSALLFDDVPDIPDTASDGKASYNLTFAENGEDGVDAVQQAMQDNDPFAAAFVDMNMPGIDGAETSRRIWNIDSAIKIVIVTAYHDYSPDDIIKVTGRDDIFYLRKPFNSDEIRQFARAFTNQWNLEYEKKRLTAQLERAKDELEDMNENLQEKVKKQAESLIQSEKMASLGVLSAGVVHEINNPMAFIKGNLSSIKKYNVRIKALFDKYKNLMACLRRQELPQAMKSLGEIQQFIKKEKINFIMEDIVDLADESLDGVNRVVNITQNMKAYSRKDDATLDYIDLNANLDATLTILRNELKYKVEIIKDYGELPQVKCYPQQMSQVFMNIIANAAQAIKEQGSITLKTRFTKKGRRKNDDFVQIEITDTGIGISQEKILKIFDPFYTSKPVGEGTGLGLSIVWEIIQKHGGTIYADSEEGVGTAFTITLPFQA